jgi:hypothetical protein
VLRRDCVVTHVALIVRVGHKVATLVGLRHDADMSERYQPRVMPMLFVTAMLTLVVTVVRLIGEYNHWDADWFSTEAGSRFNPFGIVWLIPVVGFLLGRRMSQSGGVPRFVTGFFVPMFSFFAQLIASVLVFANLEGDELLAASHYIYWGSWIASLLALFAWPRAFVVLLIYAISARAPVIWIQYLDIQNGWQTHYGRVRDVMGSMGADERLWVLNYAQIGWWIPFTVTLGCGFAAIGALTVRTR